MNWIWSNSTKIVFGEGCIKENLKNFVQPNSKILCTYGNKSEVSDSLHDEVQLSLDNLFCSTIWKEGVSDSDYDRLVELSNFVAHEKPDLIIAVGGQSVLNGTKFIACASHLPEGVDAWNEIFIKGQYPSDVAPFASITTIPACGSEWNNNFTISRQSKSITLSGGTDETYPIFSLIDPQYSKNISKIQIRNIIFESFVNVVDQSFIPLCSPLTDDFFLSVLKELVEISMIYFTPKKEGEEEEEDNDNYDALQRLIVASLFSNNFIFSLGREKCWGIHTIAYQISSYYEIELVQALSLICPFFLENQFCNRIPMMAKAAVVVFGTDKNISDEEKARAFISELRNFISFLHLPKNITEYNDGISDDDNKLVIEENDSEVVSNFVIKSIAKFVDGDRFGFRNQVSLKDVKSILRKVIL